MNDKTPLLDNIETSFLTLKGSKALTDKEFDDIFDENLYTELISDFAKYKKLSYQVGQALDHFAKEQKLRDKGKLMLSCGFSLEFTNGRLYNANFCRQRLCPMCQRRKSLKTYSDFMKLLNYLNEYAFVHLTLTVPNCPLNELAENISFMNKCSSKLFSLGEVKKAFRGVVRCLEVTYNSSTISFHPHFHCLIAVKKSYFKSRDYIKSEKIQLLWSALWKMRHENLKSDKWDSFELGKIALNSSELLQIHIVKADKGAVPEIAKYAVKPLDFECSDKERASVLEFLHSALNGKRLIYLSGVFKDANKLLKLKLEEDTEERLKRGDVDKEELVHYYWNYRRSRYERED